MRFGHDKHKASQKTSAKHSAAEQSPYEWDRFSDQPYPIRDKAYKRRVRRQAIPAYLKMIWVSILVSPFVLVRYLFSPRFSPQTHLDQKIGLCVNLDKELTLTADLVQELGVTKLSIRIPLSDIQNVEAYKAFAQQFSDCEILFVILQDRANIEDPSLLRANLRVLFSVLSDLSTQFQLGNAINRTKWGFVSVDEYLEFFALAQKLKEQEFTHIKLFGAAIIDFEIYALLRSLWHGLPIKYDAVSALLYVDRRGTPEGKQFGFDLVGKINFIWAAIQCSSKTDKHLIISEVNWPIKDTQPYAPALGDVWVDEQAYASYLLRYYLLALGTGKVDCIYWHQLIAPGYGLIDNREGIRKRRAYYIFKFMLENLKGSSLLEVNGSKQRIKMKFEAQDKSAFWVIWSTRPGSVKEQCPANVEVKNALGEAMQGDDDVLSVGQEPIYLFEKSHNRSISSQ